MAFDALSELGYSGITTVFTEKMAAFTAIAHKTAMKGVVEINGLFFLRIQHFGEKYPPHDQTCHKPDKEEQYDDAS